MIRTKTERFPMRLVSDRRCAPMARMVELQKDGWLVHGHQDQMTLDYVIHARKEFPDFAPHPTDEAY